MPEFRFEVDGRVHAIVKGEQLRSMTPLCAARYFYHHLQPEEPARGAICWFGYPHDNGGIPIMLRPTSECMTAYGDEYESLALSEIGGACLEAFYVWSQESGFEGAGTYIADSFTGAVERCIEDARDPATYWWVTLCSDLEVARPLRFRRETQETLRLCFPDTGAAFRPHPSTSTRFVVIPRAAGHTVYAGFESGREAAVDYLNRDREGVDAVDVWELASGSAQKFRLEKRVVKG